MSREEIADVAEALLDYCENNKTFQSDKITTVSAAEYTDANQLRSEIDLVFKRVPLMLALSCELPKPGDYKAMEAVGVPILIARDKDDSVRAFLNVCAHRWAPVAAEGHGNRPRCNFICPFHGWTYGMDGKLRGIADRAKFGDIDKSTHGLKELPCEERHGMIFICLTPGATLDLDGYCGALLEEFADAGLEDWAFLGSSVLEGANWKIPLTNFIESYHFATSHPKTVASVFVHNVAHYQAFGPNMRIGFAQHSISNLRKVARSQWDQQETECFTFQRYFFPNVIGSLLPAEVSTFIQIFPAKTPDKSRITLLYVRKEPAKNQSDQERIEKAIKSSDDILREEDLVLGIQTQKGLESGAHEGLLYGRNEAGNQYFHEWLNWYLLDDENAPKPVIQQDNHHE